jgi:hypothetical protein
MRVKHNSVTVVLNLMYCADVFARLIIDLTIIAVREGGKGDLTQTTDNYKRGE